MKYLRLKNRFTGVRAIRIVATGEKVTEKDSPVQYAKLRKLAILNENRANRDEAYRACGLVKARGTVSGRIYWE